jgi:transposase
MQVLYPRCAGLDVHQKTVVACVVLTAPDGTMQQHTQTFLTMTADLLALADWLGAYGVTHVGLESSGVSTPPMMLPKTC